ncbi:MAG: hypothetical protein IKB74_05195 [Lentisphaeria bacterium]|nr:hypothetical protein [Lentisphaeria bacterium]
MKINYGIAVSSFRQLSELPELKKAGFLEVASNCIQSPDFVLPRAWKNRLNRVTNRSEARTFSAMIGSGRGVMKEFYRVFSRNCEAYARLGVTEITLTVDWETVVNDSDYADELREVLRCCYGIIYRNRQTALLEMRIPGFISSIPENFIQFRNSLLFPVRTLIDFHPHEPGALEMLTAFAKKMPFDSSRFRVSFDASGGNYLSSNLLEKILSSLHIVGKEIPEICFYPGRSADKAAFAALEAVLQ